MSIAIGSTLPAFTLKDQNGASFNSKTDIINTPCVIYFYPKNFTPECTAEACGFRDAYTNFTAHNIKVVGISSDTEKSHQKFADKLNLPFTLLADENKKTRQLFKVQGKLLGLLPGRETFVFDTSGTLVFKFDGMSAEPHIAKTLEILKKLKDD